MAVNCSKCGRAFSTRSNHNKHIKSVHGLKVSPVAYSKDKFSFKCLELNCNKSFQFNLDLINHLQVHHNFNITSEEKIFNNFEEFKNWKKNTESNESCLYIMAHGIRKANSNGTHQLKYYVCNRSGNARTKVCDKVDSTNNRKRLTKSQGSCKLKYSCISQIKLTIREGGTILMHRWKTHYGHQPEVQHLRLSEEDKHMIASKLISGISASEILDNTRSNIGATLKRINILTKKDINNVKRRFCLDLVEGMQDSENSGNIELWVERSKPIENIEQNNFTNNTSITLKNSLQEELKNDILDLYGKITLVDFNKLSLKVLKEINMHVNGIKNLLKTLPAEDQVKQNSSQSVSFEHSNKSTDKEIRCRSTQQKTNKKNIPHKKLVKTEPSTIMSFVPVEIYISHDNANDHKYTKTELEGM